MSTRKYRKKNSLKTNDQLLAAINKDHKLLPKDYNFINTHSKYNNFPVIKLLKDKNFKKLKPYYRGGSALFIDKLRNYFNIYHLKINKSDTKNRIYLFLNKKTNSLYVIDIGGHSLLQKPIYLLNELIKHYPEALKEYKINIIGNKISDEEAGGYLKIGKNIPNLLLNDGQSYKAPSDLSVEFKNNIIQNIYMPPILNSYATIKRNEYLLESKISTGVGIGNTEEEAREQAYNNKLNSTCIKKNIIEEEKNKINYIFKQMNDFLIHALESEHHIKKIIQTKAEIIRQKNQQEFEAIIARILNNVYSKRL